MKSGQNIISCPALPPSNLTVNLRYFTWVFFQTFKTEPHSSRALDWHGVFNVLKTFPNVHLCSRAVYNAVLQRDAFNPCQLQYSVLPISHGHFSPHLPRNSRKTPIARPLGRGMSVFRQFRSVTEVLLSKLLYCMPYLYIVPRYIESLKYYES